MSQFIESLRATSDFVLGRNIDHDILSNLFESSSIKIPCNHKNLLCEANGILVYDGYFRLFGVGDTALIDMFSWNQQDAWKFAGPEELIRYWCFGETAWGDQYAYLLDDLDRDRKPPIYFIESISLEPERFWDSFDEFFENEFLRNAKSPYDSMLVESHSRIGPLAATEHIAYSPSPLICGEEHPDHVMKINSRISMIANADLLTQLDEQPDERVVSSIESYIDAAGRPRIRVVWA